MKKKRISCTPFFWRLSWDQFLKPTCSKYFMLSSDPVVTGFLKFVRGAFFSLVIVLKFFLLFLLAQLGWLFDYADVLLAVTFGVQLLFPRALPDRNPLNHHALAPSRLATGAAVAAVCFVCFVNRVLLFSLFDSCWQALFENEPTLAFLCLVSDFISLSLSLTDRRLNPGTHTRSQTHKTNGKDRQKDRRPTHPSPTKPTVIPHSDLTYGSCLPFLHTNQTKH